LPSSFDISDKRIKIVVLSVFFLSGLSALIYQVVWMRMLTLVFGTTVFAATTVITVFMAGLGAGSYCFGRFVDKRADSINLLKLYALLEGGIGLYCLFTPWAFSGLDVIYGYIYALSEVNFYLFSIARFFFSSLILFIPTMLMGATLPVISRFYIRQNSALGRGIGRLYGLNTLGAVVGVLIPAFILIPTVGVRASLFFAVAVNLIIAAVTWYCSRSIPTSEDAAELEVEASGKDDGSSFIIPSRNIRLVVLSAFALSGFASLAYEVAWFRILSMTIGSTIYAFAVMLATFLMGLALGSYVVSFFIDRIKAPLRVFAFIELMIGVAVVAAIPLFGKLPLVFMSFLEHMGVNFWGFQAVNFLTAFIAIIVPTLLMGASFPLVVRIITGGLNHLGGNIGKLYGLNTLGGVLGSFLAGFVFLPFFGIQTTIISMAALNVTLGCVLLFYAAGVPALFKRGAVMASVLLLIVAIILPRWDRVLMSSGPHYYAGRYMEAFKGEGLQRMLDEDVEVLYYNEGITGTTSVLRGWGTMSLGINGKGTAAVPGDVFIHNMTGILPLMLHSSPRSALLVGLGSGVTLGAMEHFPLNEVDTVEISAEVLEASRLFDSYNHNALEDNRLKVMVDDGRSYLANTSKSYDVIINEPSVPLSTDAATLFTKEFYELAKKRLNTGGIFCQWLRSFNLPSDDLRALLRSFSEVFPDTSLWMYEPGVVLLIGKADDSLSFDFSSLIKHFNDPTVIRLLEELGIASLENILKGFTMDAATIKEFVKGAALNTDDRPLVEFATARSLFYSDKSGNYNVIAQAQPVVRLPMSGMVKELEGDGHHLPFFGLDSSLSDDWHLTYTGFSVKNKLIDLPKLKKLNKPAVITKDIESLVEWSREGSALELRVKGAKTEPLTGAALSVQLGSSASEGLMAEGVVESDGREVLWRLDSKDGTPRVVFTWDCSDNGLRYAGSFSPAPDTGKEAIKIVEEVVEGLRCASNE
jgi:spermidine synthase